MSALFDGLRTEAVRERSSLLEVSTGVGIAFFNSARHIGRQHVLDPYGEDLKPLRDEGFAAYSARVAKPYGSAIARHFDPERATPDRARDRQADARPDEGSRAPALRRGVRVRPVGARGRGDPLLRGGARARAAGRAAAAGAPRARLLVPRTCSATADAISLLEGAVAEYPDDAALKVFLALALWSGGRERDAFAGDRPRGGRVGRPRGYGRAASFYLDHLD